MSGGYEEIIHPAKSMDPADARVSLDYRGPDGRTILIWPSLYGTDVVIKGDVAIFVGDKAYVSSDPDDPRGTKPRLFAVQPPGLPLDITDEVLWYWSKASGKDFAKAVQLFNLATPVAKRQPFGGATGVLGERKRLAGQFHASTGLEPGIGNHAHGEGERHGAQGFAVGHALHRELIWRRKSVAASRQSAAN